MVGLFCGNLQEPKQLFGYKCMACTISGTMSHVEWCIFYAITGIDMLPVRDPYALKYFNRVQTTCFLA